MVITVNTTEQGKGQVGCPMSFRGSGKQKINQCGQTTPHRKHVSARKERLYEMHLCNGDNGSNSCTGTFLMCGCKNGRTRRSPPPREHMFPLERWTLSKIVPGWATSWLLWTQPGRQHENVSHWQTKKSQPYFWKKKFSQKCTHWIYEKHIYCWKQNKGCVAVGPMRPIIDSDRGATQICLLLHTYSFTFSSSLFRDALL